MPQSRLVNEITTRPQVGVGVVVRRGDRILLGQRTGSHGAGQWALPGGKLDPGEHPLDCARRELAEEAGVRAHRFRALPFFSNDLFPDFDRHFITLYVICDHLSGEPQLLEPDKCLGWSWEPWNAPPQPIFDGLRLLIDSGIHLPSC